MKKLDQKGSGFVILLVLIVAATIGIIGYNVYTRHKDNSTSKTPEKTETVDLSSQKAVPLNIAALSVLVDDPDDRKLQLHIEKICAAECDKNDSYFIRDKNSDYFDRCAYPAGIIKLDEAAIKSLDENPDTYAAKNTKKIGKNAYYVFPGSNYQAPCSKLEPGDEAYQTEIRKYILDNIGESF